MPLSLLLRLKAEPNGVLVQGLGTGREYTVEPERIHNAGLTGPLPNLSPI